MGEIDLHVHTTASDSTAAPAEMVREAAALGLKAVAVTDHDTMAGVPEAEEAGSRLGVEIVPGMEISTKYTRSIHILGYYIDRNSEIIQKFHADQVLDRDTRNERVVKLMNEDGIDITYAEMKQRFGEVVGRPHFAEILIENGLSVSTQDAFDRYLDKGQKYWLPRSYISIGDSVELIRKAGGVPVIAHPFEYKFDDGMLRELITLCLDHGLMGMECRYSGYTPGQTAYLEKLAEEYNLIKTGGSDFHGTRKTRNNLGTGSGDLNVPYEWLQAMKSAL